MYRDILLLMGHRYITNNKRFLLLLVAVFLWITHVGATSVPRFTFEQLVSESDSVASGTVSRSWTEWDASHRLIWTKSEIVVDKSHKGAAQKLVVIHEPGGERDGMGTSVAGSVQYKAGEQVLVFLKNYAGLGYRTYGWGQGKYVIDAKGRLHADTSLRNVELTGLGSDATGANSRRSATATLDGLTLLEAEKHIAAQLQPGASR